MDIKPVFDQQIKPRFKEAFDRFKADPVAVLGPMLVSGAASLAVGFVLGHLGLARITPLVDLPVTAYVGAHTVSMYLRFLGGQTPNLNELSKPHPAFVPFLITLLVMQVAIAIGMVLLVIPGLIVAALLMHAPAFVVDRQMQPMDALKASAALTRAHTVPMAVFMVCAVVLNVLGAIPLGLGLLVTAPVTALVGLMLYQSWTGGGRRRKGTGRVKPITQEL